MGELPHTYFSNDGSSRTRTVFPSISIIPSFIILLIAEFNLQMQQNSD